MPRRRGPSRELGEASTIDSGPPHRDTIPLTPQIGEVLGGRYVLQQQLGRGAFGVVYRARDQVAADVVALKLLAIDRKSPEQLERLRRELRSARRIHHPGIVRIHDLVELGEHLALSMELIDGETLQAKLDRDGPLKPAALETLARQLSEALAAAHEAGVAHRDLKPDNILLRDGTGRALIADFGVARLLELADEPISGNAATQVGSGVSLTAEGAIVGTPLYMAPEQLAGREVGFPADLYALGAILYQGATGQPPHQADTLGALIEARLLPPPDVALTRADLPAPMLATIERLLARDPAARPTAREVAGLLDEPAATPPPAPPPLVDATLQTRRVAPRRRTPWIALGVAAVVVAALAIALIVTRTSGRASPRGPLAIRVEVHAEEPADARLEPAVTRMFARRLADEVHVVVTDAPSAAVVTLGFRRDGEAIAITARRDGGALLTTSAASFADGIEQLATTIGALAADRPERPPTAEEQAAMTTLAAPSFEAFRRYRAANREGFLTLNTDPEVHVAGFRAVIADDPGWIHGYLGLAMALGMTGPDVEPVLAEARRAGDPARDPRGWVLLDAWDHFARGEFGEAIAIASPVRDYDDLLGVWLIVTSQYFKDDTDAAIAAFRRLHEHFPELQFGYDLIINLAQTGRGDEVASTLAHWLEMAPEAEQALATQAKLATATADWAAARRAADDLILLHGREPRRLVIFTDVLIASGALTEAHTQVDRFLAGDATARARGLYRLGVLGTLEGRFASAYRALSDALAPNRALGWNGETYQVIHALQSLAWAGAPGDDAKWADELAVTYESHGATGHAASARFEAAVARRAKGACPDPTAFEEAVTDTPQQVVARAQNRRIAAAAGCARCADVVQAGLAVRETNARYLLMYATCAEQEGAVDLAKRAYETILSRSTTQGVGVGIEGAYEWVLAAGRMGHLAEDAGDLAGARRWYQEVITRWGKADRPRPEVEDARAALTRLGR